MQTQAQSNLQLLKQKEDLVSCNNNLGMLLSTMESFFIKSGYKLNVLFGYYNYFNDVSWKSKQDIKNQLYINLMAYKISKMAYVKKYGKFDYPDYPPIEKIIEIINQWKNLSKDQEEKKLCDEILELINDENQKPLSYYQNKIENTHSDSRADSIQQLQFSSQIHNIIDKRNEQIKNQLEQNPNAKFGLNMGEQPGNSEFSHVAIPNPAKNKDIIKLELEKNINIKIKSLFNSLDLFLENKNSNQLESDYNELKKQLNIYFKEYKNINFTYENNNIEELLNNLSDKCKYVQDNSTKKKLYDIYNLIKNYNER